MEDTSIFKGDKPALNIPHPAIQGSMGAFVVILMAPINVAWPIYNLDGCHVFFQRPLFHDT